MDGTMKRSLGSGKLSPWIPYIGILTFLLVSTIHTVNAGGCHMEEFDSRSGKIWTTNALEGGRYLDDEDCTWEIQVDEGFIIQINFDQFEMEPSSKCHYDNIRIDYSDGQLIGKYCGNELSDRQVYTTGNRTIITFYTDNSMSYSGILAYYSAQLDPPENITRTEEILYNIFSGAQETGLIVTPHPYLAGFYPNRWTGRWTLAVPESYIIELTFLEFDLEDDFGCVHDYVEIFDSNDELIDSRLCGRILYRGPFVKTTGNTLSLVFHTDETVSSTGFIIQYHAIQRPYFLSPTQYSTEFPRGEYAQNGAFWLIRTHVSSLFPYYLDPEWRIQVYSSLVVELRFNHFGVDESFKCVSDYLSLLDSNGDDLGRFCGNDIVSGTTMIYSSGSTMIAKFRSTTFASSQIDCRYVGVLPEDVFPAERRNCMDQGKDASMIRTPSIRLEGYYPNHQACSWTIDVILSHALELTFHQFDLEEAKKCPYDYVEVFNAFHHSITGRMCGIMLGSRRSLTSLRRLTITFSSDVQLVGEGFNATYRHIPLEEDIMENPLLTTGQIQDGICGQFQYDDVRGMLWTPNAFIDGGFAGSLEHIWNISVPLDYIIELRIIELWLEISPGCDEDYVSFYDSDSSFISRDCGSLILDEVVLYTLNNSMSVMIHVEDEFDINSNSSSNRSTRFMAEYMAISPEQAGNTPLTFSSGSLSGLALCESSVINETLTLLWTPNIWMGGKYNHSLDCEWSLEAEEGELINVRFVKFGLEYSPKCSYDYLSIYDSDDTLMGRYCSSEFEGSSHIFSSGSSLRLVFHSDGNINGTGFLAQSHIIQPGNETSSESWCTQMEGDDSNIVFGTPNQVMFDEWLYPTSWDCTWELVARDGAVVALDFDTFGLEYSNLCKNDYIRVYDSDDRAVGRGVKKYCGDDLSDIGTIYSTGSTMKIEFHSDESIGAFGFRARYRHADAGVTSRAYSVHERLATIGEAMSECIAEEHSPVSGTFHTPVDENNGDGTRYPPFTDCNWWLIVPEEYNIQISFDYFQVENHIYCWFDYLSIYDPVAEEMMGYYCGHDDEGNPPNGEFPLLIGTANKLRIYFHSDAELEMRGFKANYFGADLQETNSLDYTCGQHVTDDTSGIIWAPGSIYRLNHPEISECYWNVTVGEGKVVQLEFTHFAINTDDSECGLDYLAIYDGDGSLIGKYCQFELDGALPIYSSNNSVYLEYHSEGGANQYDAFIVIYSEFDLDVSRIITAATYCLDSITLDGLEGTLQMPSDPDDLYYKNNIDCQWTLTNPDGGIVEIFFDSFWLEPWHDCIYDYVSLVDSDGEEIGRKERYCNMDINRVPPFYSTGDNMTVVFHSDEGVRYPGFMATFKLIDSIEMRETELPSCREGEFQCETGGCVEESMMCDGWPQCLDESDETTLANCTEMFDCGDGYEIEDYKRCDGYAHCSNLVDESPLAGCENFLCDDENNYIPSSWICDGINDCPGGQDERFENECPDLPCIPNPCLNGGTCSQQPQAYAGFECRCTENWAGDRCEKDNNDACLVTMDHCQNRGWCYDLVEGRHCTCLPGTHGNDCQERMETISGEYVFVSGSDGTDEPDCGESADNPCLSLSMAIARMSSQPKVKILGPVSYEMHEQVWLTSDVTIEASRGLLVKLNLMINSLRVDPSNKQLIQVHFKQMTLSGTMYVGDAEVYFEDMTLVNSSIRMESERRISVDKMLFSFSNVVVEQTSLSTWPILPEVDVTYINNYVIFNSYRTSFTDVSVNVSAVYVETDIRETNFTVAQSTEWSGLFIQVGNIFTAASPQNVSATEEAGNPFGTPQFDEESTDGDTGDDGSPLERRKRSLQQGSSASDQHHHREDKLVSVTKANTGSGQSSEALLRGIQDLLAQSFSNRSRERQGRKRRAIEERPFTTPTSSTLEISGSHFVDITRYEVRMAALRVKSYGDFLLTVSGSSFLNNSRAIYIALLAGEVSRVEVTECEFLHNVAAGPGGGIQIEQHVASLNMLVDKSNFTSNIVENFIEESTDEGARAEQSGVRVVNFVVGIPSSKSDDTVDSMTSVDGVSAITGSGGALAVNVAEGAGTCMLLITNSLFKNNTAEEYGGTMYFTSGVNVHLIGTSFYNQDPDAGVRARLGDIVESQGNLKVENCTFQAITAQDDTPLISYRATSDTSYMESNALHFRCPQGYNASLIYSAVQVTNARTSIETMLFYCQSCDEGLYSIDNAEVIISPNNTFDIIYVNNATCHPCPYGAVCDGDHVGSIADFWGETYNNRIHMYRCPEGYCCTEAECERFDTCADHREGQLCGRCEEGYSESLFSTACVADSTCYYGALFWLVFALYGILYVLLFLVEEEIAIFMYGFSQWLMALKDKAKSRMAKTWKSLKNKCDPQPLRINPVPEDESDKGEDQTIQQPEEQTIEIKVSNATVDHSANTDDHSDGDQHEESEAEKDDADDDSDDNTTSVTDQKGNSEQQATEGEAESEDGSGAYLQIFMYFIQVSSLLTIDILYTNEEGNVFYQSLTESVTSVFNFNTLGINFHSCLFPGVTAVFKTWLSVLFIIYIFMVLFAMYAIARMRQMANYEKCACSRIRTDYSWVSPISLRARFLAALVNLLLFTYQYFAEDAFILLRCINLASTDQRVLFIDSNISCYQDWQVVMFVFAVIYVFPFSLVLALSPSLLTRRLINTRMFLLSMVLPLFYSPYFACLTYRYRHSDENVKSGPDVKSSDGITCISEACNKCLTTIRDISCSCPGRQRDDSNSNSDEQTNSRSGAEKAKNNQSDDDGDESVVKENGGANCIRSSNKPNVLPMESLAHEDAVEDEKEDAPGDDKQLAVRRRTSYQEATEGENTDGNTSSSGTHVSDSMRSVCDEPCRCCMGGDARAKEERLTGSVEAIQGIIFQPFRKDLFGGLCWEGMIALRRLVLVVCSTLVTHVFTRHLCLFVACAFSLIIHMAVQPFIVRKCNNLETISLTILTSTAIMNLLKAAYLEAHARPTGDTEVLFIIYDWLEGIIYGMIPILLFILVVLAVIVRVVAFVHDRCTGQKKASVYDAIARRRHAFRRHAMRKFSAGVATRDIKHLTTSKAAGNHTNRLHKALRRRQVRFASPASSPESQV